VSLSRADCTPLTGLGVLVAADDPALRRLLECGLDLHGFVVWTVANGSAALDLFRQQEDAIHLALLNLQMPGLDGPETLTALRAHRPYLPCCFMSGGIGKYTEQDLLEMGATRLLRKPFSLAELAGVLLHLAGYPERRGEVRVAVPKTQAAFGGQKSWLRDRSPTGLGLWSHEPMVVGSLLNLLLDLGLGATLPCLLEVRHCQPDGDGWAVGCRFAS
jgi:CheY-like chemotaxis protein